MSRGHRSVTLRFGDEPHVCDAVAVLLSARVQWRKADNPRPTGGLAHGVVVFMPASVAEPVLRVYALSATSGVEIWPHACIAMGLKR